MLTTVMIEPPFVLVVSLVVALFMVLVFIYFFQKFPIFCVQVCGVGLEVRFRFRD